MKRRGREVCRGLGDLGDQLRLMGRPGPSDPVWTTRSRFYRRRLCGRKKSKRAASLSVGAGRARRATGGPPAEPSPRDRLPTPVPCCLHRAEACVGTVRDGARCATRTRSQVHDSGHLCTRPFGRLREGGREVRFHGCGFRRTSRGKREVASRPRLTGRQRLRNLESQLCRCRLGVVSGPYCYGNSCKAVGAVIGEEIVESGEEDSAKEGRDE
jgi:hypothetical protein